MYAATIPFFSLLVVSDASHPVLATLFPETLGRICGGAFFVLLIGIALRELIAREPIGKLYLAALVFAAASLLASLLGFEPLPGIVASIGFAALALCANAIERVGRSGEWRAILCGLLWGGIVFCLLALAATVLHRPAELYAFAHGRAIGIFENPNELAEYTLTVCAAGLGAYLADARLRVLGGSALLIASVTLIATGSRSGELAYAIGAMVVLAGLRPRRGIAAVVLVLALAGLGAGFALDRRHNPAETGSRLAAWEAGLRTVARFPLTGAGVGAYYRIYPFVRGADAPGAGDPISYDPHNFYLSVAAETGLVGLGTMGFMIVLIVRNLRAALAAAGAAERRLGIALAGGLAADAAHLLFNGFALSIALWTFVVALALGAARSGYGRVS